CCNPPFDGVYRIVENVGSHQDIEEKTTAAFLSLTNRTELAGMPLVIGAGVRVERTETTSVGIGHLPTVLTIQTGDATAFNVTYAPNQIFTKGNEYTYVLPNLDLNLSLRDDLKLRFDASRTLTRAPLNLLSPVLNIPGTQRKLALQATVGNPTL